VSQILADLRAKNPLVHCITNYVAMNISANVVLAAGASPAMIHAPEETADFVKVVGGLTVNIGTISPAWFEGMKRAAVAANEASVPWVLDPVAHFATPYRATAAKELLALKPTILRGNASEIMGLGGQASEAKGVDAKDRALLEKHFARFAGGGALNGVANMLVFQKNAVPAFFCAGVDEGLLGEGLKLPARIRVLVA